MATAFYHTRLGPVKFIHDGSAITNIIFLKDLPENGNNVKNKMTNDAYLQLSEYLFGMRKKLNVIIKYPGGTPFERRVWDELSKIPYGDVRLCSDIAKAIGEPDRVDEVREAVMTNPIAVVIPCHRIVTPDGEIGDYQYGSLIKKKLLTTEATHKNDNIE